MKLKEYVLTVTKEEIEFISHLIGFISKSDCDRLTGVGNWDIHSRIYNDLEVILDNQEST